MSTCSEERTAVDSQQPKQGFIASWLIMPKLLYFWLNMAIYTASSFLAKFFIKEWKLQEYQFALMMSLQVVMFFGAIFWTGLADRIRKPRIILMSAIAGYTCYFACFALPVFKEMEPVKKLICSCILMALSWMFSSCFYPIIDSTILLMLSLDPNFTKRQYSQQRMWGVPAHVLAILASGHAFQRYGARGYQTTVFSSTIIFAIIAFFTMPATISVSPPKKTNKVKDVETGKASVEPVGNPTWILLSNPSFLFFLVFGLSGGIIRSCLTNFQTHYMEHTYKMTPREAAYTAIGRIGSEMLVHAFANNLADFCGNYWLLMLSQIAGLFRVCGYGFTPSITGMWAHLPHLLEISKGLNSGLLTTAYVRIASDIAPPGCESTAQGLFSGTYTGLSMFVGGFLASGLLWYSDNNLKSMFAWIGVGSLAVTVVFFIKLVFFDRLMAFPGVKARQPTKALSICLFSSIQSPNHSTERYILKNICKKHTHTIK